ncbi:MAG: hypothetical protein AAB353_08655 [Candidatus Hydrogenedentota bacterium]
MGFLHALGPVNGLINLATEFVRGKNMPDVVRVEAALQSTDFSAMLADKLAEAEHAADDLLAARDKNGDGLLTAGELRMTPRALARIDANANGVLDRGELVHAYVDNNRPLERKAI